MHKEKILEILENAKDGNGAVPMRLVRTAFDKLPEPCEDTISRQAAIDALDFEIVHMTAYCDGKNEGNPLAQYNKGLEDGKKAIEALPSAQPEQKWIPCSERLPEDYKDVLITYTYSFELTCPQDTAKLLKGVKTVSGNPIDPKVLWEVPFADYIAFYDVDEKRWFSPTDNPEPFPDEIKVIAWMPLPEPYEGGTE